MLLGNGHWDFFDPLKERHNAVHKRVFIENHRCRTSDGIFPLGKSPSRFDGIVFIGQKASVIRLLWRELKAKMIEWRRPAWHQGRQSRAAPCACEKRSLLLPYQRHLDVRGFTRLN